MLKAQRSIEHVNEFKFWFHGPHQRHVSQLLLSFCLVRWPSKECIKCRLISGGSVILVASEDWIKYGRLIQGERQFMKKNLNQKIFSLTSPTTSVILTQSRIRWEYCFPLSAIHKFSAYLIPDARIKHSSRQWSPNHGRVKIGAKGLIGCKYCILLIIICQIFTSNVEVERMFLA